MSGMVMVTVCVAHIGCLARTLYFFNTNIVPVWAGFSDLVDDLMVVVVRMVGDWFLLTLQQFALCRSFLQVCGMLRTRRRSMPQF